MLARQITARPTNKTLTMLGGTIAITPLVQPAVAEVWPQIAPAALSGDAMTALVGAALAGLASLVIAWFVPDRANMPLPR